MPTKKRIEIVYEASLYPEMDKALEAILGQSVESGMGFGERDCTFLVYKSKIPQLLKQVAGLNGIISVRC